MTSIKHFRHIVSIAEEAGIEDAHIASGSKHRKLCGTVKGRPVKFTIPGSPGDRRSLLNLKADWKRTIRGMEA